MFAKQLPVIGYIHHNSVIAFQLRVEFRKKIIRLDDCIVIRIDDILPVRHH